MSEILVFKKSEVTTLLKKETIQKLAMLILQLLVLCSCFYFQNFELWHFGITFLVYFLIGCIGGTVTYHRLLSHRSFAAPDWFLYLGSTLGVYGFYGSPLAWASVHRDHHRYVDTEFDPHSPLFKRWWDVQLFSFLYVPKFRNVSDLLRIDYLRFLHKHYLKIHFIIVAVLYALDPKAIFYAYLWPSFLIWQLASMVNLFGHRFGYRTFNTKDNSKNNLFLGFLVFGEGWHNNHHARPMSPNFGAKWWEFDLGYLIINLVKAKNNEILP